ncbi:MAG: PQQ-binding-like beta-propeller repeat protein, partial [bacterium]|nr:PQQ-binding-like beta-propeller repeat protein [bacterium]
AHYMWDVARISAESLPEPKAPAPKPHPDVTKPSPASAESLPAPKARATKRHPDVTFHTKPKPLPAGAVTHDWKSFLGPTHDAVSTETKLLREFPAAGPTLLWELKRGTGYSSPAISGDRLVYLHRVGDVERVECLHPETGGLYWQFEYPTDFSDRYGYNNGPRASPVIDGNRVYTYGAQNKLHCFNLETGKLIWKKDITRQ